MEFLAPRLDAGLTAGLHGPQLSPEAQRLVDSMPRPLVFTNGVYDLVHPGHVDLLSRARGLGASLLLALNSDASVQTLEKGSDRPICPLEDRLFVASGLRSVDCVTWFEGSTPLDLILAVRPDILVKGGDWPLDSIVGASQVLSWGGRVYSIPFEFVRSSTQIIQRIRASSPPTDPKR